MRVRDYMTRAVLVAAPEEGAKSAYDNMKMADVRHMPVVDGDGIVKGMVSDRDLRRPKWVDDRYGVQAPYQLTDELTVGDVMTPFAVTIRPDDNLVEAAQLFVRQRFGSLPVVNANGELVGVLSTLDILRAYIDAVPG